MIQECIFKFNVVVSLLRVATAHFFLTPSLLPHPGLGKLAEERRPHTSSGSWTDSNSRIEIWKRYAVSQKEGRNIRFLSSSRFPQRIFPTGEGAAAVSIARTMAAIIEPITRHPQKSTSRPPQSPFVREDCECRIHHSGRRMHHQSLQTERKG